MNENIIWDEIIYNNDPGDIRQRYHLDYIFSENWSENEDILKDKKICLIAHMTYLDVMMGCFEYIKKVPSQIDIFITTNQKEKAAVLEELAAKLKRNNVKIVLAKNRGREMSALLIACRDELTKYEYICFVHDKKQNKGMPLHTVGQSFMDILWENSIKSEHYIKNVIAKFEEQPRLGFLTPPAPYMSMFFSVGARAWTSNFAITYKLKERLKLNCIMSENKPPFALGTTFWCRADALMPLFEAGLQYEDFEPEPMAIEHTISHAIERIFPYVAQSQGYYSGVMMTKEYASLYLANYHYMITKIADKYLKCSDICGWSVVPSNYERLFQQCKYFRDIYIFGTGAEAGSCAALFEDNNKAITGFIVSNGHKEQQYFRGYPVYELHEMKPKEDVLIIVALNADNRAEVMPELIKKGFNHIERYR